MVTFWAYICCKYGHVIYIIVDHSLDGPPSSKHFLYRHGGGGDARHGGGGGGSQIL